MLPSASRLFPRVATSRSPEEDSLVGGVAMLLVQIVGLALIGLGVVLLVKKLVGAESDLQIPGVTFKAPASVLILILGVFVFLFPYSPWWPTSGGSATGSPPPKVLDSAEPVSSKSPIATPAGPTIGSYRGSTPGDAKAALARLCLPSPCVSVIYAPAAGDGLPFRQVVRTEPGEGQTVQPGSAVVVYVSTGGLSIDGAWYEVREGELFSIIANQHGFAPWQDLTPFNPGLDYDHVEAGDLIWLPHTH
jgi:hypothetical protein